MDTVSDAMPPDRVPVPRTVDPSEKVTAPVGVPAPGEVTDTVAVSVTVCPQTEGFGIEARAVVVDALFTVKPVVTRRTGRCTAVPGYSAPMVKLPCAVGVAGSVQADDPAPFGARPQLVAERPEPAGVAVRATVPVGLEAVPPACVSVTVTVMDVGWPTTTGLGASTIAVEAVRAATVIEMVWVEV